MLPLFLTSSYQSIDGQEVTLIQNKEVSATIVLPDSPSRIETHTGRLFCRYLAMLARQSFISSTIRESEFAANSGKAVVLIGNAESNQLIQRVAKKGFFKLSQDCLGLIIIVQVKVFYSSSTIGGGNSWDWKNEGPETAGCLYTAAYQFKVLKDS